MGQMAKRLWFACFLLCFGAPAVADQSNMSFDVRLLGARIGIFSIAATESGNGYAARSKFTTVGLVGALKKMEADVTVRGHFSSGQMKPTLYNEAIDDGTRVTDVVVKFSPGLPRLVSGETGSRAPPATGAGLARAIDPLTGVYILLRDQEAAAVTCQFTADIYDGHRLARIKLNRAEKRPDGTTCHGSYRRLAGYSSSESRSKNVPLAIDYVAHQGGYRAAQVRVDTRYGAAVIKRR